MPSGSQQACVGLCCCLERPVIAKQEGMDMGKWQLPCFEISEDGIYSKVSNKNPFLIMSLRRWTLRMSTGEEVITVNHSLSIMALAQFF